MQIDITFLAWMIIVCRLVPAFTLNSFLEDTLMFSSLFERDSRSSVRGNIFLPYNDLLIITW